MVEEKGREAGGERVDGCSCCSAMSSFPCQAEEGGMDGVWLRFNATADPPGAAIPRCAPTIPMKSPQEQKPHGRHSSAEAVLDSLGTVGIHRDVRARCVGGISGAGHRVAH